MVLPEGASHEDLRNERDFRNHALQYGLAWYQYAREIRGRMCPNGSLYLVTGHDKARSWGLTSFSTASAEMRMVSVKLGIANTACWESSGCAMFRQSDDSLSATNENQCVFLRGFMISKRGFFNAMLTGQEVRVEDGIGAGTRIPSSQNTIRASFGRILGTMDSWLSGSENVHVMEQTEDENHDNAENMHKNQYDVVVQSVPGLSKVCSSQPHGYMIYPRFPSSFAIHQLL